MKIYMINSELYIGANNNEEVAEALSVRVSHVRRNHDFFVRNRKKMLRNR